MKHPVRVSALWIALITTSNAIAAEPMPTACDILQAIDIAATLGSNTNYLPGTQIENKNSQLSMCSAETADLSARMTLMLRENLAANVPDATTQRNQMIDELRSTIGNTIAIEKIEIGDAALWVDEIGQLSVWHREGKVMLIFSPTPISNRAAAEVAARKTIKIFP